MGKMLFPSSSLGMGRSIYSIMVGARNNHGIRRILFRCPDHLSKFIVRIGIASEERGLFYFYLISVSKSAFSRPDLLIIGFSIQCIIYIRFFGELIILIHGCIWFRA